MQIARLYSPRFNQKLTCGLLGRLRVKPMKPSQESKEKLVRSTALLCWHFVPKSLCFQESLKSFGPTTTSSACRASWSMLL